MSVPYRSGLPAVEGTKQHWQSHMPQTDMFGTQQVYVVVLAQPNQQPGQVP